MNEKPVVVGIDDYQPELFRFALEEARRLNTTLRVVHAQSIAEMRELGDWNYELFDQLRAVAAAEPDVKDVSYVSWWAEPADILIGESRGACEVVVGADEVPWLTRVSGGEVARMVAMKAACPVVVAPRVQPGVQRTSGIVVAIDTADDVDAPLRFAFEAALLSGEPIQVVEAVGSRVGYAAREARRYRLEDVVAPWRELYPEVRVRPVVEGKRAVAACVLATRHASLLVLGRPRDHHSPMSLDAVAARVLRRAQAPVAVVPLRSADDLVGAATVNHLRQSWRQETPEVGHRHRREGRDAPGYY